MNSYQIAIFALGQLGQLPYLNRPVRPAPCNPFKNPFEGDALFVPLLLAASGAVASFRRARIWCALCASASDPPMDLGLHTL